MSKLNPQSTDRAGGPAPFDSSAEPEPDFANEHESTSYADDLRGGPEGAPEPESPTGRAGMDPA